MTTYLARSAWTSTTTSGATLTGSKLRGVAVHWPGTTQAAIGDPGQAAIAARLRSYRTFHVESNGWSDIGYNIAIDQGGRVWMCRSTQWRGNRVGAHCASVSNPDANHEYVGVLLLLGQNEPLSAKMIDAFQDWYHTRFLPGWPGCTDVRGHGQVPGAQTNCPGTQAKRLIANGTLTAQPNEPLEDDDMFTDADRALLERLNQVLTSNSDAKVNRPDATGTAGMRFAAEKTWEDTHSLTTKRAWESPAVSKYVAEVIDWKDPSDPTKGTPVTDRYILEVAFSIIHRMEKAQEVAFKAVNATLAETLGASQDNNLSKEEWQALLDERLDAAFAENVVKVDLTIQGELADAPA